MTTILVIDDRRVERRLLYHTLKREHRVLEAEDGAAAMAALEAEPVDLVILDMHLPPHLDSPREGMRLRRVLRERDPLLPVVVATGDTDRELALQMVRQGVTDFLLKPVDPDVLRIVVERALERARLEREVEALRAEVRSRMRFGRLIGRSPAMQRAFGLLERLARVPTTVLLLGESGTGKSAAARALHNESPRADGPFVVVDGAAIPESLLESELFGHVKGAFTGAEAPRVGRIQQAHGGTLFLDEIGNLSPAAQAKLLLFLDERKCLPVGGREATDVDVRLVAATNLDLDQLVSEGRFRADLLYRLQVATVVLPPLRERPGDVLLLAEHLLVDLCDTYGRPRARLAESAADLVRGYPWPGNVRQLKHVLEGSLVLVDGDVLDAADLVLPTTGATSAPVERSGSLKDQVAAYEYRLVADALEASGGNKAAAGRMLGLDENQIRYLCRKHGL